MYYTPGARAHATTLSPLCVRPTVQHTRAASSRISIPGRQLPVHASGDESGRGLQARAGRHFFLRCPLFFYSYAERVTRQTHRATADGPMPGARSSSPPSMPTTRGQAVLCPFDSTASAAATPRSLQCTPRSTEDERPAPARYYSSIHGLAAPAENKAGLRSTRARKAGGTSHASLTYRLPSGTRRDWRPYQYCTRVRS